MTDITLKLSREMAKRALDACEVNNDRDAASALYKAITHAGINAVEHERMQSVINAASIFEDIFNREVEDGDEEAEANGPLEEDDARERLFDALKKYRATAK
jgi:hypothetical protein